MVRLSYSKMTRKLHVAGGTFAKAKAARPVELVAVIASYLCISRVQALAINAADPL